MIHTKDKVVVTLYDETHETFIDIDNEHGNISKVNHKTDNEEIVVYFICKKPIGDSDSIYCVYFCHKDNKTGKILDKNNKPIDAIMNDKLCLFASNLSVYIETSNDTNSVVVLTYEKNKQVIEDRYVLHKTFKYTLACSTIL